MSIRSGENQKRKFKLDKRERKQQKNGGWGERERSVDPWVWGGDCKIMESG